MLNSLFAHGTEPEGIEAIGEAIDVAAILEQAGELFGEVWPLIALAIGIPLAFYIARRVKGLVNG